MGRPLKRGLDYFSFDVDFFDDEKIMAISREFGIKGEITAVKLLCAIYRNGYFALWNDALKQKLLMVLPGVSEDLLVSIVNRLVLWGFSTRLCLIRQACLRAGGSKGAISQRSIRGSQERDCLIS